MSETRDVVEEYFRRIGAGEHERLPEMFADDVDWDVYGAEEVPWIGRRTTRADVAAFFPILTRNLKPVDFALHRILVDGEHAVVIGHMRQTVVHNGNLFDSPIVFHLTVENGLITRCRTYEDSLNLARAYGVV
ncbi:nuclear transport factor 2 family protein [Embleya sp. NPDC059237]|uniref:nuclear transport factor 2 family protein n=1 Tax=Embleya sp. NPDC059237 TaxID=3346784 RepID=UPI0036C7DBB4